MYELDLKEVRPPIARVFGLSAPSDGYRLAPDEQLVVGDDATAALENGNSNAVDVSSAFTCFELSGEGWEEAFSYLSEIELPAQRPGFVQGHVADIPAKAIVGKDLLLLIPANYAHHVRAVILQLSGVGITVREVSLERASA